MARKEQLTEEVRFRQNRFFSEAFRRKKVEELDKKLTTVAEICKTYDVSDTAVYKWIYKYSLMRKKAVRMVVEPQSDTARIQALQQHISQLEQLLGQKQFEIDFLKKQMDLASEQYGVDLKKKRSGQRSGGSGNTGNNTPTK
jgi:transposase-like protein